MLAAGCRDHRELGLGERERSGGVIALAHPPNPVGSTLLYTVSPAWSIFGGRPGRPLAPAARGREGKPAAVRRSAGRTAEQSAGRMWSAKAKLSLFHAEAELRGVLRYA